VRLGVRRCRGAPQGAAVAERVVGLRAAGRLREGHLCQEPQPAQAVHLVVAARLGARLRQAVRIALEARLARADASARGALVLAE